MSDGWVTGDRVGISFPAHPDALRDGGVAFLTKAFHTSGVLDSASAVVRIDRCEEVSGGAVDHYRAMLTAVARLAGTHRAGRLPDRLTDQFPVDLRAATVGEPPPLTPDKLHTDSLASPNGPKRIRDCCLPMFDRRSSVPAWSKKRRR